MFVHRLKLRAPQLLPTWIGRPNVERRFAGASSVFSVVAGPGYGKTVLAARVFAAWEGPKAWYSLDEEDADLAVFAAHLEAMVTALPGASPLAGDPTLLGSPKELGSLFADVVADCQPTPLLVFDDVQVLASGASLGVLGEFVDRASRAGTTFLLSGRSMPLPLHGVASRSRLGSAGAADLAFDQAESRAYLRQSAAPGKNEGALDRLAGRAEGWPAGLALLASTAASHLADADLVEAHDEGTRQLLFDYLAAEVLDALGERERRFLLDTSILDILERETCDAVAATSDAAEILRSLARRGLFVTRRSEDAYTVHALFREFLRDTLANTAEPAHIAELHRRAALSFAQRGDNVAYISHILDAGDLDAAAAGLEMVAFSMLESGMLARVDGLLQRVGRERVERSATLLTVQGRLEHWRGDPDRSLAVLERAMAIAREAGDDDVYGHAVRVASSIHAARGNFAELMAVLTETLALPGLGDANRASLSMTLGAILLETGRYDEALATFGELMPSVVARGDLAMQARVLHNTAVAHVRRGEPYAGLAMYQRALKIKRSVGQRVSAMISLGNLIFVLRLLGDLDEAERLSNELLDELYDVGNATLVAYAMENQGALKVLRGDCEGAALSFRAAERGCDPADMVFLPDIWYGLAQVAFAAGNSAEADELCAKAISILSGAARGERLASLVMLRAECALAKGEFEHAGALAIEACEFANAGADTVLAASTGLDAAALLVRLLPKLPLEAASETERLAAAAASSAIAVLHQKNYRFLLRTKAKTFADLGEHLRRWGVGRGLLPDAERPVANAALRIELLGGLRVLIDGDLLPATAWKRRRARDVFAYLVSLGGKSVSRSRLIDLYWPDTDADAAHDNLRVTISAVRKAIGDVIKFEGNGYRFAPPPKTSVDTELFDENIELARQSLARGAPLEVRQAYMAAAELYRGDFLEGLEEGGWQWRERERMQAAALEALRWLVADREGEVSFRRLMLDRLLELAPFEIDAVRMRLEFMLAEMRVDDARKVYDDWKQRYRSAIGEEPPELWEGPAVPPAMGQVVHVLSHPKPHAGRQRKA
jgi:ATP/maltotriose-dependent transcriptional regulator MalT/DNA-binding SARP family transcriptional activator